MKKFTEIDNSNIKKYAGNQVLKNKINDIIKETLSLNVNGVNDNSVSIDGTDELVEKIEKFVTANVLKSGIDKIKSFKINPVTEKIEQKDEYLSLFENINDDEKINKI
ncbi:hypothetical protein M0Q50_01195 [bacterium]|jgi:hypothetical protein|nr:hypothetical protein [bacterium]